MSKHATKTLPYSSLLSLVSHYSTIIHKLIDMCLWKIWTNRALTDFFTKIIMIKLDLVRLTSKTALVTSKARAKLQIRLSLPTWTRGTDERQVLLLKVQ